MDTKLFKNALQQYLISVQVEHHTKQVYNKLSSSKGNTFYDCDVNKKLGLNAVWTIDLFKHTKIPWSLLKSDKLLKENAQLS